MSTKRRPAKAAGKLVGTRVPAAAESEPTAGRSGSKRKPATAEPPPGSSTPATTPATPWVPLADELLALAERYETVAAGKFRTRTAHTIACGLHALREVASSTSGDLLVETLAWSEKIRLAPIVKATLAIAPPQQTGSVTDEGAVGAGSPAERDARLRATLLRLLADQPEVPAWQLVEGALATLIDLNDRDDCLAFDMVRVAIAALAWRSLVARKAVLDWHTRRHRADGDSAPLAMVEMARAVDLAAALYPLHSTFLPTGSAAVAQLRAGLVRRYGERNILPLARLEDMLQRHSPKKAVGRITTAGIVAKILFEGQLLGERSAGAKGRGEEDTLDRVSHALTRHAPGAERKKRTTKKSRRKRRRKPKSTAG